MVISIALRELQTDKEKSFEWRLQKETAVLIEIQALIE